MSEVRSAEAGSGPGTRRVEVDSEEAAQGTIDRLYAEGAPIHVRGSGYFLDERPLDEGGIVLANAIRTPIERVSEREVRVSTGWTWAEVLPFLESNGLSVPVLTSNLNTTVGGTLSAGGFGLFSHRSGIQADHVSRFTIHTGTGRFECARSGDPLWRAALCSLGGLGFVSSATLEVGPQVHGVTLLERRDGLEAGIDIFLGAVADLEREAKLATCRFERGAATTRLGFAEGEPVKPVPPLDGWREQGVSSAWLFSSSTTESRPSSGRVWNDYLVPLDRAGPFMRMGLDLLRAALERGGVHARMRALSVARAAPRASDSYLRPQLACRSQTIGVGYYLDVDPADRPARDFADSQHALLKAACESAGGAPYQSGTLQFSEEDCRSAFGGHWDSFKAARRRYDPRSLFGTGGTLPLAPPAAA